MDDPSLIKHGAPPFPHSTDGDTPTFQYLEHAQLPILFETDASASISISPEPCNYTNEAFAPQRGVAHEIAGPGNVHGLSEASRKRKHGRQTNAQKRKKHAAAARRANAPASKASIKRAQLIAEYGAHMIGADEELKGETRSRADGFVDWKQPGTGNWLPAAPHDWFRLDFINIGNAEAPYLEPPANGLHELDITSNCTALGQNTWTFDPQGWDNIVDSEGNKVMFLKKAPPRFDEYPQVKYWRHKGLLMLDPDDHPVLDWASIPMVFSSKLEGGRMEALKRVFPWLRNSDFRARMPRMVQDNKGELNPLPKYSTFGQRLSRFRDRTGCAPWTERAGSSNRWKCSREGSEHADDTQDTVQNESGSDSSGESNGWNVEQHTPDASAMQPQRRQRTSSTSPVDFGNSGLRDPQSFPFLQGDGEIGLLTNRMAQQYPTLPGGYHGIEYSPARILDQFGVPNTSEAPVALSVETQSGQLDLRFAKPKTTADELDIKKALHVTRADFRSIYEFDAPTTPDSECYQAQYQIIQAKHAELWMVDDNPPALIGIGAWFGSFETWPTPHLTREEFERILLVSETTQSKLTNEVFWANPNEAA